MKTKIKTIYYCEFCKKKSMRIDTMKKHETICTLNPSRKCGLCGNINVDKRDIQYLKNNDVKLQLEKKDGFNYCKVIGVDKLREFVKILKEKYDCPVCLFSVLRQGLSKSGFSEIHYNLEEEMKKYWEKEEKLF